MLGLQRSDFLLEVSGVVRAASEFVFKQNERKKKSKRLDKTHTAYLPSFKNQTNKFREVDELRCACLELVTPVSK